MRYGDGSAFRQALEQRLKTHAGEDGARLARDRKRVAFDRLLARLATIAPDSWLLKGGFALDLRLAERARATKDVDLDWQAAEAELLDTLLEAAEWDAADFFSFNIERTGRHRTALVEATASASPQPSADGRSRLFCSTSASAPSRSRGSRR